MSCPIGTHPQSKKWLSLDICGLGCVSLSYSFHIFALHTIYSCLISFSDTATLIFYIGYLPCSLLALINLIMAQHTDPGAIPIGARPLPVAQQEGDETFLVSSALLSSSSSLSNADHDDNRHGIDYSKGQHVLQENMISGPSGDGSNKNENKNINGVHSNAMTGIMNREKKVERRRGVRRCRKCGNNYKPPRAHHDSVTGRCISKFDHFCPVSTVCLHLFL